MVVANDVSGGLSVTMFGDSPVFTDIVKILAWLIGRQRSISIKPTLCLPPARMHFTFRQRCPTEYRMAYLLGVHGALQLGEIAMRIDSAEKDGLVLVHA
jgi:hypothetical protein